MLKHTYRGDVVALEHAWSETGQDEYADRYIRHADKTHHIEAIEVLINDGVRSYLLNDLREGRCASDVKRPHSIWIIARLWKDGTSFEVVVPARIVPGMRESDGPGIKELSVLVTRDTETTTSEVVDMLRAAYFHASSDELETINSEREAFDQAALRAAGRTLGQHHPGCIDIRVTITDTSDGWKAEATATPLDNEHRTTAARTGGTRASAADAAIRAAIRQSNRHTYGIGVD